MDGLWKIYFELNGVSQQDTYEFCKRISEKTEEAVFYLHPTKDKTGAAIPHIHGYVFNWPKSDDTFRSEIKKKFNVSGTEFGVSNTYERGKKMSRENLSTYITYMSKGKFEPFFYKGVSSEFLEERKREWKDPLTVRISGDLTVITGAVKRKEVTQYTMARELSVWILEQQAANVSVSKTDIVRKCVSILTGYGKSRHYRNVANICQDAMWDWQPDYNLQKILSML